jgi:hypothetical protein
MTEPRQPVGRPPITVKRYADRRLFDSAALRYRSVDELRRMVEAGATVVVLDAKTGEDVTQAVLDAESGAACESWHAVLDELVALAAGDDIESDKMSEAELDDADELRRLIALRIAEARTAGTLPQSGTLPAVWYRRRRDAVRLVQAHETRVEPAPESEIDSTPPAADRPAPRRPLARG